MLLYVYFHVTNHAWVANTKWTPCNFGWIFFHSAWCSRLNFCIQLKFFYQYFVFNINCVAIEQSISCIFGFIWSILVTLYLWQMAFLTKWSKSVPNGAKEDACRTGSVWKSHEKTNCHGEHFDLGELTARSRLCILNTVDSQWAHQEVTVSSRWAPDFFSWVIMKMISYRIKGFVTDNVELKTFFKLKCMFLNLIFFIYGVVIAYQLCFQYFIFSFKNFL